MIPKHGYVVRETPDDTYAIYRANALGVVLSNAVAEYRKEHVARQIADSLNLQREFEVSP